MKKTVLILMLLLLLICNAVNAEELVGKDYIMSPGDQLQVIVYGHDDLSSGVTPYVVRPDGKVSFPLIGDIDVTGKTVDNFTKELTAKFSEYVINPQVGVNVIKLGTTRVYVLGEVERPGLYELEKSHRVIDALSRAEGFTERASKKKIYLVRNGATEPILVNINDFLKKADQSQNYVLYEGDCLYLSRGFNINFSRDILPLINGIYMVTEIQENEK